MTTWTTTTFSNMTQLSATIGGTDVYYTRRADGMDNASVVTASHDDETTAVTGGIAEIRHHIARMVPALHERAKYPHPTLM